MLKNLEWQTFRVDTALGQCAYLLGEVVVGHVNIALEENGLNPSNVPSIVIDHNL